MIHVKKITTIEEFFTVKRAWNSLLADSHSKSPFLSWEWLFAWWKAFAPDFSNASLMLYLFFEGGDLIAAFPFYRSRETEGGLGFYTLRFLVNAHTPRGDFIIRKGKDPDSILRIFFDDLQRNIPWTMIHLKRVPISGPESAAYAALQHFLARNRLPHVVAPLPRIPFVALTGDFNGYWTGLRPDFRRNLQRRKRNLEKLGAVEYRAIQVADQNLTDELEEGLDLEASGWKGRAGSAIKSRRPTYDFYRELFHNFIEAGQLYFFTLRSNGRLLAFDYCLVVNRVFYLVKIAYAESFGRYSPGNLLKRFELEWAYRQGLREYDFLGRVADWKTVWTDQAREQADVTIYSPRSALGLVKYVRNGIVLANLRKVPLLRKIKSAFKAFTSSYRASSRIAGRWNQKAAVRRRRAAD